MNDVIKIINIINKTIKGFTTPVATDIGKKTKDPFKVLISTILSLRTRDETTGRVSKELFKKYDNPEKLANAKLKDIQEIIRPVNYYIGKSKRIKEISQKLVEEYKSKVPEDFNELLKFKGVGRKTANIVMLYGHNQPDYIAVDIHMHRIPNRLGWIKTKKPEETEEVLKKIVPRKYWWSLNNNFVAFGQNICLPVSPKCSICPVRNYCKRVNVKSSR